MPIISFDEIKIGALYLVTPVLGMLPQFIIFVTLKIAYDPNNMFTTPLIHGISGHKQIELNYYK